MSKVQHKRGLKANLPSTSLNAGEIYLTTDRNTIHAAKDSTTMRSLVPAVDDLSTMPTIDVSNDLIIVHDVSTADANGYKEKKATVQALKDALNIPAGSADEKVAVVSGGTAGYLYGTNGTDGILRVASSLSITKDSGNAFMTLDIAGIDAGTF